MPSSNEGARQAAAALLEKIEALSFLRALNDRLARAPGFAAACRGLVDLVWEERVGELVAYVSVDPQRRVCRLEALAPPQPHTERAGELGFDAPPFAALLERAEPAVLPDQPPPPGLGTGGRATPPTLLCAPTRVRDATTGLLLVWTEGDAEDLEERRRLLAIAATSAALALDVARSEAREEFLAMLRHDINNPVTIALGYTEIILDQLRTAGDETLAPLAASVLESLKTVADLVSNYLHMAAIDRGVPWLHREPIDLGTLVADIVDRFRPSAVEKDITLTFTGESPPLLGDRRQLGRVLTNLLSNAVKYTPAGGRIDVTLAAGGNGVTLAVADTGYGLAAADTARLFTKYARFHRDRGIPGTGLGLYLSKAIVEAHGGTLEAASAPGEGSTFTVRLPPAVRGATRRR
ncbi:MAG TPA: HAMP domain-containing sensor histidine kinase [Candidatus Binatia bacterium]|nr:HAMP domain-containing sensor histidine kinase [Candidatus Binatia bacterium]